MKTKDVAFAASPDPDYCFCHAPVTYNGFCAKHQPIDYRRHSRTITITGEVYNPNQEFPPITNLSELADAVCNLAQPVVKQTTRTSIYSVRFSQL